MIFITLSNKKTGMFYSYLYIKIPYKNKHFKDYGLTFYYILLKSNIQFFLYDFKSTILAGVCLADHLYIITSAEYFWSGLPP